MRIVAVFSLLIFCIGCKKEQPVSTETSSSKTNSVSTIISHSSENAKKQKIDTVFFTYDENTKRNDYALVSVLDRIYNQDSISSATFKIDFISKKQLVYSHQLKIKNIDNGAEWYGNLELDSINSPLKTITLGYPACGYTQYEFLFYINPKSKSNLIHHWETVSDGGWGTWSQIIAGKPEDFICRTESFSPKEDETEDLGIAEYSDSIQFKFVDNQWKQIYKTPKGKIYRSKILSFDAFHK